MLNYFAGVILLIISINASAQRSETLPLIVEPRTELTVEKPSNWSSGDFDGTFQITTNDCDISITITFIDYVKSLRDPEQDLILDLGDTQSVLIISAARIADPNYIPFENMVVCTTD